MAAMSGSHHDGPAGPARKPLWRRAITPLALGLGLAAIYAANYRNLGSYDTEPATMMVLTFARGEGVFLDRFRIMLRDTNRVMPVFVRPWKNHILSRYPVAPALLVEPLVAPQIALLDWLQPDWDRNPARARDQCAQMARYSLAMLMALTAVLLHQVLITLGLRRAALPATLAMALGSNVWTIGSQALWQHGPAAFLLVAAIALLQPANVPRWRLILAGFVTALLIACRLIDGVFAVMIVLWLVQARPRNLFWFLPVLLAGVLLLLAYNIYYFGELSGGQAELEQIHRGIHHLPGPWSGNLAEGALGTLFSPGRGLFVYTPWVALVLPAMPLVVSRLGFRHLVVWLLLGLVPYFLLLSKYAVWWGGHCFGPRYWTDVMPLFAIMLAFAIDWAIDRSRLVTGLLAIAIVLGIAVQTVGAYCYPSTWNFEPVNVDVQHDRLWNWRDNELSRCLTETWRELAKK